MMIGYETLEKIDVSGMYKIYDKWPEIAEEAFTFKFKSDGQHSITRFLDAMKSNITELPLSTWALAIEAMTSYPTPFMLLLEANPFLTIAASSSSFEITGKFSNVDSSLPKVVLPLQGSPPITIIVDFTVQPLPTLASVDFEAGAGCGRQPTFRARVKIPLHAFVMPLFQLM